MTLLDLELMWLAGLLEGEGSFGFRNGTQRVQLQMTDEDVVLKAAAIVYKIINKHPNVYCSSRLTTSGLSVYGFTVNGKDARLVMKTIISLMDFRRRQCIWQSLNNFTPGKSKLDKDALLKLVHSNG